MKRIRVIVGSASDVWDAGVVGELEKYKNRDTALEIAHLATGPESIEDAFDEAWAVTPMLEQVLLAAEQDCDGVIIYCFGDPALRAAKVGVCIPVVALGEGAVYFASLLGLRFGIITAGPADAGVDLVLMDNLRAYELAHKCAGLVSIGVPVLDLVGGEKGECERVLQAGRALIDAGAEVLILGCGSMLGVAEAATRELGVPVVIPGATALKLCEAMIDLGVSHSKKAFRPPVHRNRG